MERSLRCHSVSQAAVKCTAVFALVTLLHTLLVLNGRGLLFPEYLTFKTHHRHLTKALSHDTRAEYDFVDKLKDREDIIVPHHLQFQEEDHDGKNNSALPNDDSVTFSPKRTYSLLGEHEVSTVEKFVIFVGYSRSGHSIVASLLDAHPNIIIAHEYNLFRKWKGNRYQNRSFLYNELYRNSYNNAARGWRSRAKDQKGYTLEVKDSWQGSFQELLVIGEKSGAVTAQTYDNDPLTFVQALNELRHTVQVPIRVIHIVRNPYDMISTRLLYADSAVSRKSKLSASVDVKHSNRHSLSMQVNRTIHIVQNVQELLLNCSLTSLEVHLADLILNPEHVMNNLCMFLGVECSREYLKRCSDKIYARQSQTRKLVDWPEELIDKVYQMIIKPHQPFWRYSFTSS